MSFSFGKHLCITLFGQSHADAIGVAIDGLPAGERIDLDGLGAFLARRAPGQNRMTTPRREKDAPRILSGLVDGVTCGAPVAAVIENGDTRSRDYAKLRDVPRPSHADYPASVKYGGYNDIRGGGHFSARMTAPLCIAGGICLQLLARRGVEVGAHIASIAGIADMPFDPVNLTCAQLHAAAQNTPPVLDAQAGAQMQAAVLQAASELDSVGGVVECAALGLPAGVGDPLFDSLESQLAHAVFSIPAVRGIEFGTGFAAASMRGSEHNDPYYCDQAGAVKTRTNHHGGVIGGLSSGMPLLFRTAFKPTPSIAREQQSVSLSRHEDVPLTIEGRHDPCVVLRAVPCVEAATAIVLLDNLLAR